MSPMRHAEARTKMHAIRTALGDLRGLVEGTDETLDVRLERCAAEAGDVYRRLGELTPDDPDDDEDDTDPWGNDGAGEGQRHGFTRD